MVLLPTFALSQAIIRGTVVDSLTAEPLVGASVMLEGTAVGAPTDIEGRFRLTGVPSGTYSLKVSYLGYHTSLTAITLTDAELLLVVRLTQALIEGEEVVVTGQLKGQIAAVNQQITSKTVVNVVSKERIQELPDVNAAEVIGRLPGVAIERSGGEASKIVLRGLSDRFSSFTIDGVRIAPTDLTSRGVDLSTISQGSLAGIELFKALTPDKDGDAIAGSVNLVTKIAPVERHVQVDAKGIYNQLNSTFAQYDLSVNYGERFFDALLGVQVTANIERRDRSNERTNIDYGQAATNVNDYEITNFLLEYTQETRRRGGASLLLDYALPDGGTLRWNSMLNSTSRAYAEYSRNYPTGSGDLLYGVRDREREVGTFNSSLRGDHRWFGVDVSWGLSFAQSRTNDPYDYSLDFLEPSEPGVSKMQPIPSSLSKGPPERFIDFAYNNFDKAFANMGYYRGQKSLDRERGVFVDVKWAYTLGDLMSGEWKGGAKVREKQRFRESSELASAYYLYGYRRYEKLPDGTVRLKNFAGTRFDNLLLSNVAIIARNLTGPDPDDRSIFDRYRLYPQIRTDALRDWYRLNRYGAANADGSDPEYARNADVQTDYYDITERVPAVYLMHTASFGESVTFIAGARMEREDNDYRSRFSPDKLSGFPTPSGRILDTTSTYAETIWLPNAHLTLRPFSFMNIRLAAYRALARPDFDQRLEYFVARDATGTTSVEVGNPRLRAAKAWNYEVNTSFFGPEIGLFSVSAFYKEVTDMFHLVDGINIDSPRILDSLGIRWVSPFPEGQRFRFTYPYNSSHPTKVWGFEVEHQANLSFLPGLLRHVVLSYNLSAFRSETYVTTSRVEKYMYTPPGFPFPVEGYRFVLYEDKQKLETQPEFFGNVAVGYDIGGFSGRLSVFFQSEYNRAFSGDGRSDQIQGGYSRWDLALKQQVTDNVSVFVNANNLTNFEEASFIRNRTGLLTWTVPNTAERYDMTVDFGVRVTL